MKAQSFREIYDAIETKIPPTPKQAFIGKIAKATMVSENTVYNWLAGRQKPTALTQSVIAKTLGVPVEGLFPEHETIITKKTGNENGRI